MGHRDLFRTPNRHRQALVNMTVTLEITTEQATLMAQLFGLEIANQENVSAVAETFIARSCAEAMRRQEEEVRQRLMGQLQSADIDTLARIEAILAPVAAVPSASP